MGVYDDLAHKMRDAAIHHARTESPPTMRFAVVQASSLVLDQLDGDLVLHEGDPDVTIADTVDLSVPVIGDMALVEQTGPSDNPEWIVTHIVKRGNSG